MEQWFFRITATPTTLLRDHELIDWPERTKTIQRNWIGRSEAPSCCSGSTSSTRHPGLHDAAPTRSSARPFFVLAPEHRLVDGAGRALAERRQELGLRLEGDGESASRSGLRPTRRRALHRFLRHQPGNRGSDPGLGRRLRAEGVRHRRDHGRARPRRARRAFAERFELPFVEVVDEEPRRLVESAQFSGSAGRREAKRAIVDVARRARAAAGRGQLPPARLGASRASATGARRSRSSTATELRDRPRAGRRAAVLLPSVETTGPRASRRWPRTRSG
jgi:hypothetical protein